MLVFNSPINPIFLIGGLILAYFIGQISPARILAKMHGINIEESGSGNPGTTNVQRVMGNKAGAITLAVDILKGVIPTLLSCFLVSPQYAMVTGVVVIMGHIFPILYRFKGGKGVATTLGVLLAFDWKFTLLILPLVIIVFIVTRKVSLSVLVAALAAPLIAFIYNQDYLIWISVIVLLIFIKHRANIGRILKGTEPKVNFSKKKEESNEA